MSSFSVLCIVSIGGFISIVVARNTIGLCQGIHEPGKNAFGVGGGVYSAYPDITSNAIILPSQTYAFNQCNFDISRTPPYSWDYQCCGTNNDDVCMAVYEDTQTCTPGTGVTVHSYTFNHTQRTFNCDAAAPDCTLAYDWYHNCNQTGGCDLCFNYAHVNVVSGGCAKDYTSWGGFQGYYVGSKCSRGNTNDFLSGHFVDDRCMTPTPGPEGGYNVVNVDVCGQGGGPAIKNLACNDVETATPTTEPTGITSEPSTTPTFMPTATPTTGAPTRNPSAMPTAAPTTGEPTSNPSATPTVSPVTANPTASPITGDPTVSPITAMPSSGPTASPVTTNPTLVTLSPTQPPSIAPSQTSCDDDEDCEEGYACKWMSLACMWSTDASCKGVCVEDGGYCEEEDKGNKWGSWNHLLNDPDQCKLCYCKEKGARHCAKIYTLAADKVQWQERVAETCPYTQYPELNDDGEQCAFEDLRVDEPVTECSCDVLRCVPGAGIPGKSHHLETMVAFGIMVVSVVFG